jgi:Txe/YoeB family toxin of Txe-Axe toxin-antitoxin module
MTNGDGMDSLKYAKTDELAQWNALKEMLREIDRDAMATRGPIMAEANRLSARWHRRMTRAKRKDVL